MRARQVIVAALWSLVLNLSVGISQHSLCYAAVTNIPQISVT